MASVPGPQRTSKKPGEKKKKVHPPPHLDMTPMVDIAFLLLIFFMVTTVFRTPQTLEINIPPSQSKAKIAESNVMTVRILPDSRIFWNVGKDKPVVSTMNDIQKLMVDKGKENEKLVVLIKIARKSPYSNMVDIMDEMLQGNIQRFSITKLEDKEIQEVAGI